jgi:hypothetical protein
LKKLCGPCGLCVSVLVTAVQSLLVPPRFAYWTILIDDKPTAFRAQKQEELLPTFKQLSRTNTNIVMRWFARGRLWDSPEQAQWARVNAPKRREQRDADWRPGGENKDPRARFSRRRSPSAPKASRGTRAPSGEKAAPHGPRGSQGAKGPAAPKPSFSDGMKRPKRPAGGAKGWTGPRRSGPAAGRPPRRRG